MFFDYARGGILSMDQINVIQKRGEQMLYLCMDLSLPRKSCSPAKELLSLYIDEWNRFRSLMGTFFRQA